MCTPEFVPETFPPTGGVTARGVRNVLGRTAWSRLAIAVREAIQNSWDARLEGARPSCRFSLQIVGQELRAGMEQFLLGIRGERLSEFPGLRNAISRYLRDSTGHLLFIEDRGTRGLGGPVSPRDRVPMVSRTDFLDFVFFVGSGRKGGLEAGTYGFGKSAFFGLSKCRVILVDTMTLEGERRLIGCALTEEMGAGNRTFTGRAWWGVPDGQGGVLPLVGAVAEEWAEQLGFPPRDEQDVGTTIAILDPELPLPDDRALTPGQERMAAGLEMREAIIFGCWPKLVPFPDQAESPMRLEVVVDGVSVELPDPKDVPALKGMPDLLNDVRESVRLGEPAGPTVVAIRRYHRTIGFLGRMPVPRYGLDFREKDVGRAVMEAGGDCCVACMRPAELVATYKKVQCPSGNDPLLRGVFMCVDDEHVERAFAAAEPPTHDGWVTGNLEDEQRRIVTLALRKVREEMKQIIPHVSAGEGVPALARQLGRLLVPAATHEGRNDRKRRRRERRNVTLTVQLERVFETDLGNMAVVTAYVTVHQGRFTLSCDPSYVADGGVTLPDPKPVFQGWSQTLPKDDPLSHDWSLDQPLITDEVEKAKYHGAILLDQPYRFDPGISIQELEEGS